MAQLKYSADGRLLFTKEMKRDYTILFPQMLPVHFRMFKMSLEMEGYKLEMLETVHRGIVDTGLKYVHNDTCYPALLVIGQMIDALESGKYDVDKCALLITQTGGGCRASNYIHLLRKALAKAGLSHVPVISLNLSGLDKNPGFGLSVGLLRHLIFSMVYGDLIMTLSNQCRPYEIESGATDALVHEWERRLIDGFKRGKGMTKRSVRQNLDLIAADFAALPRLDVPKIRVGIVGEIYVKYAPLGNNNLEHFLLSEGCEPVIPGLLDFVIFKINNRAVDVDIYGGKRIKRRAALLFQKYIENRQADLIAAIAKYPQFRAPGPFAQIQEAVKGYLGYANKMGEGWLLTGEMLELVHDGITNIVCTQPFGCLPNHIAGKGMIRAIKNNHPQANIVAIDYDPGATEVNQENRIRLMLANARQRQEARGKRQEVETKAEAEAPVA